MSVNYVPPGERLFRSRHRVTRRNLEQLSSADTDWTTVLDLPIDSDTQLISYAVPVIGSAFSHSHPPAQCTPQKRQVQRSTVHSDCSFLSTSTDSSSVFEPDLKRKMQGNLSLESLIQENKKKITKNHESFELFDSLKKTGEVQRLKDETNKEVLKLKHENRHLVGRERHLEKLWQTMRNEDSSVLLLSIRRLGLYWFGIPEDLRKLVYNQCLYDYEEKSVKDRQLFDTIEKCVTSPKLARQIYGNFGRSIEWFNKQSGCKFTKILETRLQQQFSGLYYHLKDTLKISIFNGFLRPLIINGLTNALQGHTKDELGLELLDILIFSVYNNRLESVILDDFLFIVLRQTHYKFFSNEPEMLKEELRNVTIDLVDVLEAIRQTHGKTIIDGVT